MIKARPQTRKSVVFHLPAPALPGGRLTVDEVRCARGDPSITPPRGPSRCGCVEGARLVCCRWCSVVCRVERGETRNRADLVLT